MAAEGQGPTKAGVQRAAIRGSLHGNDKGRMAAPAAAGAFAGAFAADIGVIDLGPRPGDAKLVPAVALNHRLHQLVLDPPGGIGRTPEPAAQLKVSRIFLYEKMIKEGAAPILSLIESAKWWPVPAYLTSS
jgi:hypothetical protein